MPQSSFASSKMCIRDRYKDMELPAIIVIPGIGGSMGLGMNEVRESAKRAIGADILLSLIHI